MKEPVTPPPLLAARQAVIGALDRGNFHTDELPRLIKVWHNEIKTWEDNDTLKDAFDEGRLTYRTVCHEGGGYDYGNVADIEKRILGLINNDSYQRVATHKAGSESVWVKSAKRLDENIEFKLDAGAAGIKRRTVAKNFVRTSENSRSNKHRLGLHDLSTSLLNPDGYVLKRYSNTNIVVLMPLPLPEDVQLFYRLREQSKAGGSQSFKDTVVILASEFTRPKLASALDMGTTFVIAKSARHGGDSVKYVKGNVGTTSKDLPQECSATARVDYRRILKGSTNGANEVTVAYRQNGHSNKFPRFAICMEDGRFYDGILIEVDIRLPDAEGCYADYKETGYLISSTTFEYVKFF